MAITFQWINYYSLSLRLNWRSTTCFRAIREAIGIKIKYSYIYRQFESCCRLMSSLCCEISHNGKMCISRHGEAQYSTEKYSSMNLTLSLFKHLICIFFFAAISLAGPVLFLGDFLCKIKHFNGTFLLM